MKQTGLAFCVWTLGLLALAQLAACNSSSGNAPAADGGKSSASGASGRGAGDAGTATGDAATSGGGAAKDAAVGGGSGSGSCADLVQCLSACDASTCESSCSKDASAQAVTKAQSFASCVKTHSCTDAACLQAHCAAELAACGLTTSDGGAASASDAGDAGGGGGGGAGAVRVQGRCEYDVTVASMTFHFCWTYDYDVTSDGSNSFVESYYYYDATNASSGQSTCSGDNNQTFTGSAGGAPASAQSLAASIVSGKQQACSAQSGTLTQDATGCASSGSAGHCTETGTNTYKASDGTVTMNKTTQWAVP